MAESTDTPGTSAAALTFTFSTQDLRVILIDDEPWFVAADVADILEYRNAPDMARMCDEDEKGTQIVRTLGGDQKMTVISEPGLYRVIANSRSERAKPFQRKLFHEILPAIRKTGAYVAPNARQATATPAHVNERLTAADLQNIKRVIWFASNGFQYEGTWNQAIWSHLRQTVNLPSPQPFGVDQLPLLAAELRRVNTIAHQTHAVIRDIETQAAKRMLRQGENMEVVIADLRRIASERMSQITENEPKFNDCVARDLDAVAQRQKPVFMTSSAQDEIPGYFAASQGAN